MADASSDEEIAMKKVTRIEPPWNERWIDDNEWNVARQPGPMQDKLQPLRPYGPMLIEMAAP